MSSFATVAPVLGRRGHVSMRSAGSPCCHQHVQSATAPATSSSVDPHATRWPASSAGTASARSRFCAGSVRFAPLANGRSTARRPGVSRGLGGIPANVQPRADATELGVTAPARGDAAEKADAGKPHAIASPEEFDALVKSTSSGCVIVVDLYARWCRKCKSLAPRFERLSAELGTAAEFVTVDVNAVHELPGRFEVKFLPTFVFIVGGKVVESYVGAEKGDAVQDHIRSSVQTYLAPDYVPPADAKDAVPPPPAEEEAATDWRSLAERISASVKSTSPTESPSPLPEPRVTEVTSPEQFDELVAGDGLVAVDFFATWCRKCKYTMPKFARASARHPEVAFASVDVNAVARVPAAAGVRAMPSFQFWRRGEKLGGFEGAPTNFDEAMAEHIERFSA